MADERSLRIEDLLAESAWLRRLAHSLIGDPHLAEDFAQEAMLAALRNPPRPGTQIRAWLTGTLRNLVAAWRRGDAHRRQREESLELRPGADPRELIEQVELQKLLAEALLALPEPYRRTVLLRYYQGLSSAEIARRSGIAQGTIRWRLMRGLDELRARLDQRDEHGRAGWVAALGPLARIPDAPAPLAPALAGSAVAWRLGLGAAALVAALIALIALVVEPESAPSSTAAELALAPEPGELADGSSRASITAARGASAAALEAHDAQRPTAARIVLRARAIDPSGVPVSRASLAALGAPTARSGQDGRFELTIASTALERAPFLELVLTADGRIARTVPVRWRGEPMLWLGDIELELAASIAGRVLDSTGRPAAGALVLVDRLPGRWDRASEQTLPLREWSYLGSLLPDSAPRVVADDEGRFRFDALDERYVRLWAREPGSFACYSEPIGARAGETVRAADLVLIEPLSSERIDGRVVDPAGEPVPHATIRAWRATRPELYLQSDWMAYHARADERGRFALPVNPNPIQELCASDPRGRWRPSRPIRAKAGEPELVVRLEAPASFELRVAGEGDRPPLPLEIEVVDAASGLALESLRVDEAELATRAGSAPGSLLVDLPARSFALRVGSPGWSERELGPFQPEPALVREPIRCDLARAPRRALRVRADGAAVGGARVQLLARAAKGAGRAFPQITRGPEPLVCSIAAEGLLAETLTDEDGRAELALARGGGAILRVVAKGYAPLLLGPLDALAEGERAELELELDRGGSIAGRVLVDAQVDPAGTLVAATRGDGELRVARVGPSGWFRFDGLGTGGWQVRALTSDVDEGDPGELALLAHRVGEERARADLRFDVDVSAGRVSPFDLDLRSSAAFVLEGELGFDGEPPGPWRIALSRVGAHAGEAVATASVDPRGRFRIAAREPGLYELRAWLPDYRAPRITIQDRVELRPGGARWSALLDTAWLEPRAGTLLDAHPNGLHYVWRGAGELACAAWLRAEDVAAGHSFRVPAGAGSLVLCADAATDPFAAAAVRELDLAIGARLVLPLD